MINLAKRPATLLSVIAAVELLAGCGRSPAPAPQSAAPTNDSPIGALTFPAATNAAPVVVRNGLPTDFPSPPAPGGFTWLNPTQGGNLESRAAVTLDQATSFLAALWRNSGDTNRASITNLVIAADDARSNTNQFQGTTWVSWWSTRENKMLVDTNSLPAAALNYFEPLVMVGHEHAIRLHLKGGVTTNFVQYVEGEAAGYVGGVQTARDLRTYVKTQTDAPAPLRAVWEASLDLLELEQSLESSAFKLRHDMAGIARGFRAIQRYPVVMQDSNALRTIWERHQLADALRLKDTYRLEDTAAVELLYEDARALGTRGSFVGEFPLGMHEGHLDDYLVSQSAIKKAEEAYRTALAGWRAYRDAASRGPRPAL